MLSAENLNASKKLPRTTVVIVNYKTANLVVDCLRSLKDEVQKASARVVVVDNASPDDSVPILSQAIEENGWQHWARLMPLADNRGFAAGNNAAIREALRSDDPPGYFWLLNPDTTVHPGALTALVDFLEENPETGIAGSLLENADGAPQSSARRFPGILSEFESGIRLGLVSRLLNHYVVAIPPAQQCHPADWVPGASMMIRREVLEDIGLMDEAYFLYFEEVDFCLRAARKGWKCWYVPESRVTHFEGQATNIRSSERQPKRLPRYWFQARWRYFKKNLGLIKGFMANTAYVGGHLVFRLKTYLKKGKPVDPPFLLWDFCRYNLVLALESVKKDFIYRA